MHKEYFFQFKIILTNKKKDMIDIQELTAQEQLDRRKKQNREAQHRYYDKKKREKREKPQKEPPKSYDKQYIKEYQKAYYQKNKEIILSHSKDRYANLKNISNK